MGGDYTKFSFKARNRFSGAFQQQGRVQLDSDWNEAIDIIKRRFEVQALDTFGAFGVPQLTPDAFKIGASGNSDLWIAPGRLYVDGLLAEIFPDEKFTYLTQKFFPSPPGLPKGGAIVYLDVWEREVTYIQDPSLLDAALGGVDTATRTQTIWQVRIDSREKPVCGLDVGEPPSAGRLTVEAIAPPAPDDPCLLPPAAGYRGLENRLYRVEIHTGGPIGTARFKWSRDNGSIVSAVTEMAASGGGPTTLTVRRIGRDQFLRFAIDNWVTVTDDRFELMGQSGAMARISDVDHANNKIVLDRALPTGGQGQFGGSAADVVARHTRIQRWDQTPATNTLDSNGLITTAAGPIELEDGIRIFFDAHPVKGSLRRNDYWCFWARTASASVEELDHAPPRGIVHHYVQLAAITGLGGNSPAITNCRPPAVESEPPAVASDLTQIDALSWHHGAGSPVLTDPDALPEILNEDGSDSGLTGFVIRFTKNVETRFFDSEHVFQVLVKHHIEGLDCRCPIVGVVSPVKVTGISGKFITKAQLISAKRTSAVAFLLPLGFPRIGEKLSPALLKKLPPALQYVITQAPEFWVVLRCDFVIDENERAVDGEFARAQLPTGDGLQGGTFESWFKFGTGAPKATSPPTTAIFELEPAQDAPRDVPFVPTPPEVVDRMLEMADVRLGDFVIDLGSGDGRIAIAAAKKGARALGVDIDPQRVREAQENARKAGVEGKVTFRRANLFDTAIGDATVLTMYLTPDVNLRLRPRILDELKPGTRVVSHAFDLADWKADRHAEAGHQQVFMWVVPAKVAGRCPVESGPEPIPLAPQQQLQNIEGSAEIRTR